MMRRAVALGSGRRGAHRREQALGPSARQALSAAHALRRDDKHGDAADAFADLASRAAARDRHRLAAHLYAEAAASHIDGEAAEQAVANARLSIEQASKLPSRDKALRKFGALLAAFREQGLADEAAAIEAEVRAGLGVTAIPEPRAGAQTINRAQRRQLPKKCPVCTVVVDTKAIVVAEDGSVDCPSCGVGLMG